MVSDVVLILRFDMVNEVLFVVSVIVLRMVDLFLNVMLFVGIFVFGVFVRMVVLSVNICL